MPDWPLPIPEDIAICNPVQIVPNGEVKILADETNASITQQHMAPTYVEAPRVRPVAQNVKVGIRRIVREAFKSIGRIVSKIQPHLHPAAAVPIAIAPVQAATFSCLADHRRITQAIGHISGTALAAVFEHGSGGGGPGVPDIA